ncbi:Protein kinase domain-containing protein [Caenorhabditis elegans]|nr:Protein kinase domain-containing protein [Caenorhabditis elegans]CCD70025.1 Protein kinase domain-containing protein [Caenorhabditis elegans]|eukprot:NP_001256101.1 Uncharacterized protein CELE_F45F2.11 [Caenorhabditis elegans]
MLKLEYKRGERGAFPPFPPPPLPSMMIAASNAVSFNAFDEVKRAAQAKTAKSPSTSSLERRAQRFCPADFQPLPPPHIYIEMIRTLAPHQYIDLTYALAGSVLLEMGVKIPDRYPNLPPKIEPYRDIESEEAAHWTEMSSQSSSEGEYSDASESAKLVQTLNRRKNKERRETRKIRIVASMLTSSTFSMKKKRKNEGLDFKHETFPRDYDYKEKTLSTFIPPRIARRPPIPPPQFFFPPSPHFSREPHSLPPMPMMLPIPLPPMSLSSPISPIHFQKNLQSTPERPSRTDSSRVHAKQIKNDIIIVEKVTDV